MRAKVVTVMRWYAQDEVNQEDSEQNEVDGMKKGADGIVTLGVVRTLRVHYTVTDRQLQTDTAVKHTWYTRGQTLLFSWLMSHYQTKMHQQTDSQTGGAEVGVIKLGGGSVNDCRWIQLTTAVAEWLSWTYTVHNNGRQTIDDIVSASYIGRAPISKC